MGGRRSKFAVRNVVGMLVGHGGESAEKSLFLLANDLYRALICFLSAFSCQPSYTQRSPGDQV